MEKENDDRLTALQIQLDAFVRDTLDAFQWSIAARDHYYVALNRSITLVAEKTVGPDFANTVNAIATDFFKKHKVVEDGYVNTLQDKWNPNNRFVRRGETLGGVFYGC